MNKFLEEYIKCPTPSGFENEFGGQTLWVNEIKKYTKVQDIDTYGSAYAITGNLDSDYTVVIDSHIDEIGWSVAEIKDGFIKVDRLGGTDHQTAPASKVNVWGKHGKVTGIFGHPAIHLHDRKEIVELEDLFIDIGATSDEEVAEMGIEIGVPITYDAEMFMLGKNFISGRAFDDKLGGYSMIEVAKRIKENNIEIPYRLIFVNSVQEETGLHGSHMITQRLKPNVAIAVDVCHETTPECYKKKECTYKDGCQLSYAPSIHRNVLKHIRESADKNDIKYTLAVRSRSSGTNADSYAFSNSGVPTALISIPIRYMHSIVESAHRESIQSCIDLLYHSIINIKENQDFGYKL